MITLAYNSVKAKKPHICNFCSGTIEPGTKYYRSSHVYDGSVYTWKSHIDCSKLTTELNMDGDEGITQDIFVEDVNNKYYELTKDNTIVDETSFKERLNYVITKTIKQHEH